MYIKNCFFVIVYIIIFLNYNNLTALANQSSDKIKTLELADIKKAVNEKKYTLVDTREKIEFIFGHIPTAINIPFSQIENKLSDIINDTKTQIIFYCINARCPDAQKSAEFALKSGYQNISIYKNGFQQWKNSKSPVTNTSILKDIKITSIKPGDLDVSLNQFIIFDFAGSKEYGKINTAIIADYDNLKKQISKFDKSKKIVVYHLTENLSKLSANLLINSGIKENNIFYLKGGLLNWLGTGRKTIKKN